jgi:hypothetical protein
MARVCCLRAGERSGLERGGLRALCGGGSPSLHWRRGCGCVQLRVSRAAQGLVCNVAPSCSLSAPVDARKSTLRRVRDTTAIGQPAALSRQSGGRCRLSLGRELLDWAAASRKITGRLNMRSKKTRQSNTRRLFSIVWSFQAVSRKALGTSFVQLAPSRYDGGQSYPAQPIQHGSLRLRHRGISVFSADAHVLDRSRTPAHKPHVLACTHGSHLVGSLIWLQPSE